MKTIEPAVTFVRQLASASDEGGRICGSFIFRATGRLYKTVPSHREKQGERGMYKDVKEKMKQKEENLKVAYPAVFHMYRSVQRKVFCRITAVCTVEIHHDT